MIRGWLPVLLALGAASPAAAAGSLCDDLATRLRAGDASRLPYERVLEAIAKRSDGTWAFVEGKQVKAKQKLAELNADARMKSAYGEMPFEVWVRNYPFAGTHIGMLEDVQGTLRCQSIVFYE